MGEFLIIRVKGKIREKHNGGKMEKKKRRNGVWGRNEGGRDADGGEGHSKAGWVGCAVMSEYGVKQERWAREGEVETRSGGRGRGKRERRMGRWTKERVRHVKEKGRVKRGTGGQVDGEHGEVCL